MPLVLVTTAVEPWTGAHLDPLLEAIDRCDHVDRPQAPLGRAARVFQLAGQPAPAADLRGPGPRRPLAVPAPSRARSWRRSRFSRPSSFLDVEILAKATFLGHLIDEVEVPPLARLDHPRRLVDRLDRRSSGGPSSAISGRLGSGPAEDAQGEAEGDDGPGGEDHQGVQDVVWKRPAPSRITGARR